MLWSLVIALGGFLFGFDTAVISGVEQSIQQIWKLNNLQHGLTVSIALIGTVAGALLGSAPSDYFGRKRTLYFIACLYLVSSIGTALSTNWYGFLFFRLLGGLGVGGFIGYGSNLYIRNFSGRRTWQAGRIVSI